MTESDGFGIPVSFEFVQRMAREAEGQKDISRMRHDQYVQDVHRMLDEMSVPHLVLWAHVLSGMNRNSANYLEGTIVTILRAVHKVCPACGEPSHIESGTTCPG